MNITYLIGNGFDIQLGLKTKFSDFYDRYLQLNEHNNMISIRNFCNSLRKDREIKYCNWSDFEKRFPQYITSVEEGIEILEDFSLKFCAYLKELEENIIPVDENLMNKFNDFIYHGYKNAKLDKEKNKIEEYISKKSKESKLSSDSESGKDIKSFFSYYLEDPKGELDGDFFNFVNFNYTHSLQVFLDNWETEKYRELHIHGSTDGNIIIGINHISQLPSTIMNRPDLANYFVKSKVNELIENKNESNFKDIVAQSDMIVSYGVSFGESDESRWEVIRSWFINSLTRILIVYQHNPVFRNFNMAFHPTYLQRINQVKRDFLLNTLHIYEGNVSQSLCDRLILIDSENVLNLKLVNNDSSDEGDLVLVKNEE